MRKILSFVIGLCMALFIGYTIYNDLTVVKVNNVIEKEDFFVLLEDMKLREIQDYMYIEDQIYFSASFMQEYVDRDMFIDEAESVVIITDGNNVGRFYPDNMSGTMNGKEILLVSPLKAVEKVIYIPYNLLKEIYRENLEFNWNTNSLVIDFMGYDYIEGEIIEETSIYASPHNRSASIGKSLPKGERVVIFSEEGSWFKVRTNEGLVGYASGDSILIEYGKNRFKRSIDVEDESSSMEKEIINLTWDYTYGPMRNIETVPDMQGVNVIAPTWFDISDEEGNIFNKGNLDNSILYRNAGYEIWPAVTNSFDPEMTSIFLRSSKSREKIINDLLELYKYYQADGINIDFENIYYEDRDYLTQFVRELYPVFKYHGMTVSMDVTAISTSPNWSMVYDRERLQQSLDYVVLMAYDQHWASSPVAGSVAEYWWVEESVSRLLEQVPPGKLVLGMPFYSRVWDVNNDGVSSQAVTMKTALEFIDKNEIETVWDEISQQYYGEMVVGETTRKIWLEDKNSLYYKVSLVHKYNLAGIATWRKGFEIPSIWESLDGYLN
ncbi:glycosyl hydrolase family 18 protein [Gudongella sp. SC589]|jgi:spore germination protein YaaH|uniref:glycosyl hydrolase family 18 protein n=1 Tax=Gudongella sp. SC589 TaxID=3385990 RepID=UPI003904CEF8